MHGKYIRTGRGISCCFSTAMPARMVASKHYQKFLKEPVGENFRFCQLKTPINSHFESP